MIEVTAAVIIENKKVLLARRKQREILSGFWEFPGGKIELGESPQLCIERELREEFKVTSEAGVVIAENTHSYNNGAIKLIAIRVELNNRHISLSVHDKVEWVAISGLLDTKLAPADIPIAEKIQELCIVSSIDDQRMSSEE